MKRAPPKRSSRPAYEERALAAWLDELTADAREQLEAWDDAEQTLFHELLEDASSELQRELLGRALAAGHDVGALHAFADALRPMSDREAFAACTSSEAGSASARSVVARLRAEADPLFAFEANGHSTQRTAEEPDDDVISSRRIPPELLLPVQPPAYARPARATFEEESRVERTSARGGGEISRVSGVEGSGRPYASEIYSDAARAFGISYREEAVDSPRLSLEKALERVADALSRNLIVPATIGGEVGEFRRDVLILQVQPAGKSRSFQLHDPFSAETVWAHERDLLARLELPFKDKRNRRLTAVSLPVSVKPR